MRWCALVLFLLCLGQHAGAKAQAVELRYAAVGPGDTVRVRTILGETIEAPLVRITNGYVSVHLGESLRTVAADSIESLWIRRNSVRRGAIVGAFLGALPTYVVFARECGAVPTSCESFGSGISAFFILASAGVGAIFGAQIGSLVPRWELLSGGNVQSPASRAPAPRRSWVGFKVRF